MIKKHIFQFNALSVAIHNLSNQIMFKMMTLSSVVGADLKEAGVDKVRSEANKEIEKMLKKALKGRMK